ncbi:lysoplasmalogenase family protein [Prescottella subtropica]|uniref:lysoplasmalogenase family protein n=1 Tax=Prescottella subtropica TaxID=2545757 RepID=UPI0010F5B1A8|nr:lysoplasmalogenase family protein [Prescottella subtropica]
MAFGRIGTWLLDHAEHFVFAGAAAATVYGGVAGSERVQQVAKPLIAPALAARVLRRRADLGTSDTVLLVTGLAAATVGDVFMIDPDDDTRLRRGATSFAVMQSAYSALLATHGARPRRGTAAPRLAAWATASGLLAAKAPAVAPTLTGYGALLGTTATLAADPALAPDAAAVVGLPVPNRRDRRSWLGLGGLLFTGSDGLIVVRKLFLRQEKSRVVAEGAVLASYAAAQVLLVEGMIALGIVRTRNR